MAYKMVAERDNEKCSFARESRLLIAAKAKVWASEGWRVVITDQDGKTYDSSEFDELFKSGQAGCRLSLSGSAAALNAPSSPKTG